MAEREELPQHTSAAASTSRRDVRPAASGEASTPSSNVQNPSERTDIAAARHPTPQRAEGTLQVPLSNSNRLRSAPLTMRRESSRSSDEMPYRPAGASAPQLRIGNGDQRQRLRTNSPRGPPSESTRTPSRPLPSGSEAPAGPSKSAALPAVNIGIETEFYLAARYPQQCASDPTTFVCRLAEIHNKCYPKYPQIVATLQRPTARAYQSWMMVKDRSLETPHPETPPWPLELVSPILKASSDPAWRTYVQSIWRVLRKHYVIMGNASCSTHVHVSIEPSYKLADLRRVAQAVVHFEPAFEALVPEKRRGNKYARYNWLDGRGLGQAEKSRPDSVLAIGRASSLEVLVDLMQAVGPLISRHYAWNFFNLFDEKKTVEFRKAPVSLDVDDVLCWAELAMSFVRASVGCESAAALQKVPATVGGLRWFLLQFHDDGLHEPDWLQSLWAGRDPGGAVQPQLSVQKQMEAAELAKTQRINKMAAADLKQIQQFAKTAREPYW